MTKGAAHLTFVFGEPHVAAELKAALREHGVNHATVVAQLATIRRSLVLGESDFVVVCVSLEGSTVNEHGSGLRRLLADHQCFPSTLRTIGLLPEAGLSRQLAELGCDVYVESPSQAAEAIQLLERTWRRASSEAAERRGAQAPQISIHSTWMGGSLEEADEVTSPIAEQAGGVWSPGSVPPVSPRRTDRSGRDLEGPQGPQ